MKKKILLLILTFALSLGFVVNCFAADEPVEDTDTYSLSTELDFIGRIGYDRNRIKIDISNMPVNYVIIPYFFYSVTDNGNHWLNISMAVYSKNEDVTYISARSQSERNFIQSFYDKGQIKITEGSLGAITSSEGISYGLGEQSVIFLDLKSNNYRLPYYVTSKFCSDGEYPFSLSDVVNKGTWFINGNNYPFTNNAVYSSDIYSPALLPVLTFRDKNSLEYTLPFQLYGENVKYKDTSNYYLEIWTSSLYDNNVVFQSSFLLDSLDSDIDSNGKVTYKIKKDFYTVFPLGNPYQNFTVFVRLRYDDNSVKLVSSYQHFLQQAYMSEDYQMPKVFQVDNLLPDTYTPDSKIDGTINPGTITGNYSFGDFSALDFVNGGGGLGSLADGVAVVFSFLPPWLWQMMWYILGALAVIALLKVIIS